jgi:hypothetical protein
MSTSDEGRVSSCLAGVADFGTARSRKLGEFASGAGHRFWTVCGLAALRGKGGLTDGCGLFARKDRRFSALAEPSSLCPLSAVERRRGGDFLQLQFLLSVRCGWRRLESRSPAPDISDSERSGRGVTRRSCCVWQRQARTLAKGLPHAILLRLRHLSCRPAGNPENSRKAERLCRPTASIRRCGK